MQFNDHVSRYLSGSCFSSGLIIKIGHKNDPLRDRFTVLEDICRGKDIVHLGCVDHLPLIEEKIRENTWLHARLCSCAHRCLGIDINSEGIECLINKLGYSDVVCADITRDNISDLSNKQWDYLVIGEILEHVDNPCTFLTAIHDRYCHNINHLVITVPNAFSLQNISHAFSHEEYINTDHRYWFTPYTLGKIVTLAGMTIKEFFFCEPFPLSKRILSWAFHPKGLIQRAILERCPATRQTLVMVVKL